MRIKEEGERRRERREEGVRLTHRLLAEPAPEDRSSEGPAHSHCSGRPVPGCGSRHILSGCSFRSRWKDAAATPAGPGRRPRAAGIRAAGSPQPIRTPPAALVTEGGLTEMYFSTASREGTESLGRAEGPGAGCGFRRARWTSSTGISYIPLIQLSVP